MSLYNKSLVVKSQIVLLFLFCASVIYRSKNWVGGSDPKKNQSDCIIFTVFSVSPLESRSCSQQLDQDVDSDFSSKECR